MDNQPRAIDSFADNYVLKLQKERDPIAIKRYNLYCKFCVNPKAIVSIQQQEVITDNNESTALAYEARLFNGSQILIFHFTSGLYKNEIWTQLWQTFEGQPLDPLPIPQINYEIIKNFLNGKKLS